MEKCWAAIVAPSPATGKSLGGSAKLGTWKRTETTIETHEVWVIRGQERSRQWCAECSGQLITPDDAASLISVSPRVIYRWVDAGLIHFSETDSGLFVCPASLSMCFEG